MNGRNGSIARLTAIVVVVGLIALASVACARGGPAATSNPSASLAAQVSGTAQPISTASDGPSIAAPDSSPNTSASGSPVTSPTAGASRTAAQAATPDPLDSELRALDQIVNDVNGSVSGSDASASGGE